MGSQMTPVLSSRLLTDSKWLISVSGHAINSVLACSYEAA